MPTDIATATTLDAHLAVNGWKFDPSTRAWYRPTDRGEAVLRPLASRFGGQQFELTGGAVPQAEPGRLLAGHACLYGPAKFVGRSETVAICRVDLPNEFPIGVDTSSAGFDSPTAANPQQTWANAVTACATGKYPESLVMRGPDESLVAHLARDGYSASFDDGELHVHVHLPGLFQEISIREEPGLGTAVIADLLALDELSDVCREAALRLAEAANDRLELVRLVVAQDPSPAVLRAMMHVSWTPIPGAWLLAALEAVEAAVALTARELAALRDRELAELVLAARAA